MAMITSSFDTVTKKYSVAINNVEVDNIQFFSIYQYGNIPELSIETSVEGEEGIRIRTIVNASSSKVKELAKTSQGSKAEFDDSLIVFDENKEDESLKVVSQDLAKLIGINTI